MTLARRWALVLSLAALAASGLTAMLVEFALQGEAQTEARFHEEARREALELRLELLAARLGQRAGPLGSRTRPTALQLEELAGALGLDQLLWLDEEGRVLHSRLWGQAVGLMHPAAGLLQASLPVEPILWPAFVSGREAPRWLLGRALGSAPPYRFHAAIELDQERLAQLGREAGVEDLRWSTDPNALTLPLHWQTMEGAPSLAYSIPPSQGLRLLSRLRLQLALLALVLVGFALLLSPLLARTLSAPVRRLALQVGELGRGGEELAFEGRGSAETEKLAEALSSLERNWKAEQEQRLLAERRAAWRTIAQRVAHEIRNAIAPLSLALENIPARLRQLRPEKDAPLELALRSAHEQLDSLSRLASEFSDFARLPPARMVEIDLGELFGSFLDVAVELKGPDSAPAIGDAEQLRRAIRNLVLNATESAPSKTPELDWASDGGHHWIELRDRGPGLPAELVERLGEPFASAKGDGHGLGLAICAQVARSHGGELKYRPRGGGGSILRIQWASPEFFAGDEDR